MAGIQMFDPLSTEIRSPLIAGLTEACNKLSTVLDLGTNEFVDLPLSPVDSNLMIYQTPLGNKLWLSSPKPVIKKNGKEIKEETGGFTINYLGGSIEFDTGSQPSELDNLTASAHYIVGNSNVIEDILEDMEKLTGVVDSYKGVYADLASLEEAYPSGTPGDYAIVSGVDGMMFYLWNDRTKKWEPTSKEVNLSNYYDKDETNNLLNQKEDLISGPNHGEESQDEDYYYNGAKQWSNFSDSVKDIPLTGLDTSTEGEITEDDTLVEALGKLQNQIDNNAGSLTGTGAPTDELEGVIGQDYTNTSTGDKYHLTEITEDGKYIWTQYQDKLEFDDTPTSGSNNPVTSDGIYEALQNVKSDVSEKADKVIGAVEGHIATLDSSGNLVDSGKSFEDLGSNAKQATVTLDTSGWSSSTPSTRTVTVEGVLEDSTKQNIMVSPYPSTTNIDAIASYSIFCSEQGEGTLTFTSVKGAPTIQTIFNISIQNI